jgi:hypothetical protein
MGTTFSEENIMENYQFWTLAGMLSAGFGWVIHKLTGLETRVTVIETVLAMMGMPIKPGKGNAD